MATIDYRMTRTSPSVELRYLKRSLVSGVRKNPKLWPLVFCGAALAPAFFSTVTASQVPKHHADLTWDGSSDAWDKYVKRQSEFFAESERRRQYKKRF